jgi:hypothetical protein
MSQDLKEQVPPDLAGPGYGIKTLLLYHSFSNFLLISRAISDHRLEYIITYCTTTKMSLIRKRNDYILEIIIPTHI